MAKPRVKIRNKKLEKKITETPGDSGIKEGTTKVTDTKKIKEIHEDESDLEKEIEENSEKKDFSNFTFAINPHEEKWSTGGLEIDLDTIRRAEDIREVKEDIREVKVQQNETEARPRYQPATTRTYGAPANIESPPRRRDYDPSLIAEPAVRTQEVTEPAQGFVNASRGEERLLRKTDLSTEREMDEEYRKYYLEKEKQKRHW